jgi:RHS repeat-associated protein
MNNAMRNLCAAVLLVMCTPFIIFAETDSRYDTGLNLPFNEKAGDVNPQTGNITLAYTDVTLPGRAGFHFTFGRIWALNQSNVFNMYWDPENQVNELDSNTVEKYNHLGIGWSSTMPYLFKDASSGDLSLFLFLEGNVYQVDTDGIHTGETNKSNLLGYDLLDKKLYKSSGTGYGDFTFYPLEELNNEYGTAAEVGTRSDYVLERKDNSQYWFKEDGRLMMHEDRTGLNRIWYFYDLNSRLRLVVDSVGRKIRFFYDDNNLTKIEWDVHVGKKNEDGARVWETETRRVSYSYVSGESFAYIKDFEDKDLVINYEEPFVLGSVTDPAGNVTQYEWEEGRAQFTYNSEKDHKYNIYMMLKQITNCAREDGGFLNKRCFEYQVPPGGMHVKYFYSGFMEHYRVSREYYRNKLGIIMNDTEYAYYGNGEMGNFNNYSAVIKLGNITTTYTYSMSDNKSKKDVLESLSVETKDGFKQLNRYTYDTKRAKILEEVFRQGSFIYEEKFEYDERGNLLEMIDKMGLKTVTEYHHTYSLPEYMTRMFAQDGRDYKYEQKQVIDDETGLINEERILVDKNGTKEWVATAVYEYDEYGNQISVTDADGATIYTDYDGEYHAFPVKLYQDVDIASWNNGGDVHENWLTEPEGTKRVRIRSWKVFNTDGTVWIEIDNEGYAIEHYYDELGTEVESVHPDLDDYTSFAEPYIVGEANVHDFSDFMQSDEKEPFFLSRMNNPGVRLLVDYANEYVRTYADVDKTNNRLKISGKESDGLGNVLAEREYRPAGIIRETLDDVLEAYAVTSMAYDNLGRMIALTDPDAGPTGIPMTVHNTTVTRHDKTWIVSYDDMGRTKMVLYPETGPGRTTVKSIHYNDAENSITTIDPERRRIYQRSDWNGNIVEIINYGDPRTPAEQIQTCRFDYDPLNRKVKFTDPEGLVTEYRYDERNLLVEQDYGVTGSDIMTYDDVGRIISKSDRKQNIINFEYDQMGRNTKVLHYTTDPGTGELIHSHNVGLSYDNRGNAVRIANQNLIEHYIYDYGNRVIKLERRLRDGTLRERISERMWPGSPGDQVFGFEYRYNDAGMVTGMIYPDGSVHQFTYDESLARLESIWEGADESSMNPFISQLTYNKGGVVTRMDYANDTFQEWAFDNRKRISRIRITSNGTETPVLVDLKYTVNGAGDILSINDNEYEYDGFDRIVGAKTYIGGGQDVRKLVARHFGTYMEGNPVNGVVYNPGADIFPEGNPDGRINGADHFMAVTRADESDYDAEHFEYDRNGNRTRLVQNGDVYTCTYGERNRLERIELRKEGEVSSRVFAAYEYDGNGNTIKRTIYKEDNEAEIISFEYDTLNRLVRTEEVGGQGSGARVTEYFYDNAGNRFIKKDPEGTTVYLRHGQIAVAMDIEISDQEPAAGGQQEEKDRVKINRYVLSGDLLAGRVTTTVNTDDSVATEKFYYHLDHLNSTKCVTREDGTLDVMYEYRAFGEQLKRLAADGSDPGDTAKYSYSGKELDEGTELYYFNARYYDATIGRFINVDPVQDGTNWYVYCANNPLSFVDPTGLDEYENVNIPDNVNAIYMNEKQVVPMPGGKKENDENHVGALIKNSKGIWYYISKDGVNLPIKKEMFQRAKPIDELGDFNNDVNKFLNEGIGKKYSDLITFNLSDEARDKMINKAQEIINNQFATNNDCADLMYDIFSIKEAGVDITRPKVGIDVNFEAKIPFTNIEKKINLKKKTTSPKLQYQHLKSIYSNNVINRNKRKDK